MNTSFATNSLSRAIKLALFTSCAAFSQVHAQETEQAAETESTAVVDTATIEHIEVTSRHRAESLNKIPLSVSSFGEEDIERNGILNVNDIAANTVGFSMERNFGRTGDMPVIRGVSWIPGFGEQKASYFIDGVYYGGSSQALPMDLMERVEVVKGPQSALYGRRTFSGAVNFVTKRPSDDLSGYATVEAGQNGQKRLAAGASSAVNEWFSMNGSVSIDEYDGDWDNTKEGGPSVGGEETTSAMVGLYFTPTADTDIAINYIYNDVDDEHPAFLYQDPSFNNCYLDTKPYYCGDAKTDLPISLGGMLDNNDYGVRRTDKHLSLKVSHNFDIGTLTWISGKNEYDTEEGFDQTYAGYEEVFSFGFFFGGPYFESAEGWHTLNTQESDEYSHEIRFDSSAFEDRLIWSVGAYYWKESIDPSDEDVFASDKKNKAVMGSVSYDFTDDFTLSAEVRYSEDEIDTLAYKNLIENPDYADVDNKFDSTTTRVIAEYSINPDHMIYLSRSEGNSPGSFNSNSTLPAELVAIDEEDMTMYEFGWKGTLFDGALYLSTAAFFMDWDNQQLTDSYVADTGAIPVSYTSNAGETEIKGIELEGQWMITDNLDMRFGLAYTDAEFTEAFDSNHCKHLAPVGTNCSAPENLYNYGDVSGNRPMLLPEKEANVELNYQDNLTAQWEWFANVNARYDSSRYAHVHNFMETGDRTVVDMRVGVTDENWRLTVWGKNLTDDDTPTYIFRYIDAQSFAYGSRAFPISPARGREFGVTATYRF